MNRLPLTLMIALTAGCAKPPAPIERVRPVEVMIPVAQPCAGARPAKPVPFEQQTPDWVDGEDKASPLDGPMDLRQKVAAAGKWALEWVTFGELNDAATAGCPEARSGS